MLKAKQISVHPGVEIRWDSCSKCEVKAPIYIYAKFTSVSPKCDVGSIKTAVCRHSQKIVFLHLR